MHAKMIVVDFFLLFCCPARGDHDQHIELKDGMNFISIIVESGNNSVAELFPGAPVGTLIFKFDNARGYTVSQSYSNGWSDPGLILKPSESAIMLPPLNRTVSLHLEGHRTYPLPPIFHGWNLIPVKSIFPLDPLITRGPITPKGGDEIWSPLPGGVFGPSIYDAEQQRWHDLRLPLDALWYNAKDWPTNINGEFLLRGAIYFNNFAPAFGVDEPFLDANGCPLSGNAILLREGSAGDWIPLGEPVPVQHGYIDPTRDLMRYVSLEDQSPVSKLAVSFTSLGVSKLSGPIVNPPWTYFYPVGLTGINFADRPAVVRNPASVIAPVGSSAELSVVYNYRSQPPINSLTSIEGCEDCSVSYQWQRLGADRQWHDVPGAATSRLHFSDLAEGDYGTYRMKAAWGCREDFSAEASVVRPINLSAAYIRAERRFELRASATGMKQAQLEISSDLATWQVHASQNNPTNSWTTSVPDTAKKIFFRVVGSLP